MRLLELQKDACSFSLVEFLGREIPPYAILSHTWGASHEEVTYQDLVRGTGSSKIGYGKLTFCANQAAKDHIQYFWVDTCCINKESSAELSEAIASMFRWYNRSAKCYAYLSDVQGQRPEAEQGGLGPNLDAAFRASSWFTRGWTLQELLASRTVTFFSQNGCVLGDKKSLEQQIHEVTRLPKAVIRGAALRDFDPEVRISWIAKRRTTREEDMAYSLLGILNISMLPNYGEGSASAFRRLRREVRETSDYPRVKQRAERPKLLLKSLRFDQYDARRMTIKNAHSTTCTWLLNNPDYIRWLDDEEMTKHYGFLWIKGKPGTGKSTLMKFALNQAYKTTTRKAIISFFFNARGRNLEKNAVGTYRSLLFQLLNRFPELLSAFDCLNLLNSEIRPDYEWSVESLKAVLIRAISLLQDCPVICYIDAIDECRGEQVRDMVRFFENIGERAASAGIDFRICFSSRHYPHISIRHGIVLVVEGQEGHSQDIANYVMSELAIGQSASAEEIQHEIKRRSSGVFMWVVLVVKILNQEYDRGRTHTLRQRLDDIPIDLHELFRDILMRDPDDTDALMLCIQWVLFATQPLSTTELYFAMLTGAEHSTMAAWDKRKLNQAAMWRYILDASRGLVETTNAQIQQDRKVQFIHESVEDFLLREDHLRQVWPKIHANFLGRSHDRLKQCCLDYLLMDAITSALIAPKSLKIFDANPSRNAIHGFPFLRYAVRTVLHHAEVAQLHGIPQNNFLGSFSIGRWAKLYNMILDEVEYAEDVTLHYVLAEHDLSNLVVVQAAHLANLEGSKMRYGCPLFAAAARGNRKTVETILAEYIESDPSRMIQPGSDSVVTYSERLMGNLGVHFAYSRKRGVLSYLAEFGIDPAMKYLLKHGKNIRVDTRDESGRTPLWWAARAGHAIAVETLFGIGKVDINDKDDDNETPLYAAVVGGHPRVVQLLCHYGADTNIPRNDHDFALFAAINGDLPAHQEVISILLRTGDTNVNIRDMEGATPLQLAARSGQESVVKLLLERGANIDAQDPDGCTPLNEAIFGNHRAVVRLLLDRGVSINAQCGFYGNALQAATLRGNESLVELLMDSGADVNMQGGYYGTALQAAASKYTSNASASSLKTHLVQRLLDRGAHVNAKTGFHGTALQAAAQSGSTAVVKLLIAHGADVNAESGFWGTALQAASGLGREEIAKMLIEQGADVNAQGGLHGNALNAALTLHRRDRYREATTALLRKHGAVEQGGMKPGHRV